MSGYWWWWQSSPPSLADFWMWISNISAYPREGSSKVSEELNFLFVYSANSELWDVDYIMSPRIVTFTVSKTHDLWVIGVWPFGRSLPLMTPLTQKWARLCPSSLTSFFASFLEPFFTPLVLSSVAADNNCSSHYIIVWVDICGYIWWLASVQTCLVIGPHCLHSSDLSYSIKLPNVSLLDRSLQLRH